MIYPCALAVPVGWSSWTLAQDRFIVGQGGTFASGPSQPTYTYPGRWNHTHDPGTYATQAHANHTVTLTTGAPTGTRSNIANNWGMCENTFCGSEHTSTSSHTHTISAFTVDSQVSQGLLGYTASAYNVPPYYAVCFIQKN
jgi:hypothetical protein